MKSKKVESIDIKELSNMLTKKLYSERASGKITSDKPISSSELIEEYKKNGFKVNSIQIRQAVNYARKHDIPIGSCRYGYYYVLNSKEWIPTISHIQSRFMDMKIIFDNIKQMQKEMILTETNQQLFKR